MERRAKKVGFSRACIEAYGPYESNYFPKEDHAVSTFLNCKRDHGVTNDMPIGMNIVDLKKALTYGAHKYLFPDF